MSWKTWIKNVLRRLPFVETRRYYILELRRPQQNTVTETSDSICYRKANYEADFLDIVKTFPEELNRTDIAERVKKRFHEEMPCFVAREQPTDEFIGAFWGDTNGDFFLEEYAAQPVYWVRNLFVCPQFRGKGIGRKLLVFATQKLFQETCCESVLSQIRLDRGASLRTHREAGFHVIVKYQVSRVGKYWFGVESTRIVNDQ